MEYEKIRDLWNEPSELPCKYTSKYLKEVNSDPTRICNTNFRYNSKQPF